MANKTKNIPSSVVDKPTNRDTHFRYVTKRTRDPDTGHKSDDLVLAATTQLQVVIDGVPDTKSYTVNVDDVLSVEQRAAMTFDEALDFFHDHASGKLGYT